jgi:hypothetical protein
MAQHEIDTYQNQLRKIGLKTVYKTTDPTSADINFRVPTLWINTLSNAGFLLTSNEGGAAHWIETGAIGNPTSVDDFYAADTAPPGSPTAGDKYILDESTPVDAGWITAGATNDDIVEYAATGWIIYTPTQGLIIYDDNSADFYIYNGTIWELLSGTISSLTYVNETRVPRTTDNTYIVPTLWTVTTSNELWMLSDITGGVATWLKLGASTLGDAQDSVLGRTDGNNAPPSENTGDRYIIYDGGGSVVHADWDGASFNDICTFDGVTWVARTPNEGTFTEVEDENTVYIFVAAWEKLFQATGATFGTDAGNATPDATGLLNVIGDTPQGLSFSGATNNVVGTIADASSTQKGVQENATGAEGVAAAANNLTVTPGILGAIFSAPPALGGTTPSTGKFTYVDYVGAAAPSHAAGRVFYDNTTDTLNFYNAETEVALNIGEENWVKVRNETGSTITNGQIVYLSGSSSGFPLIVKAIATSESSSMVIGVVTHDIENNSNGYVTTFGLVRSLNTAAFSGGDIIYLSDTVAGSITTTKPDSKTEFVVRIGVVGAIDAANGTFHVNICCGGSLSDINSYTFNDNGFDDPKNEVTTSFVNGTRTLTIAPQVTSFIYWSEGVAYKKSSSEDIIIPDTEGSHYIYYDGDTLSQSTSWSLDFITKYALVEIIYWDAANNKQIYFGDEFYHGTKMGSMAHGYLHDTVGFALESGAGLTDILEDESGDLDSHAEFGVEATKAYDEDAEFHHSARTSTANIAVYYKSNTEASPYWRTDETASFGVLTTGTGRAAYNFLTGGNWTQAEVSNNDFVLAHVFTFNDSTRKYGIIQGENSYLTRSAARDGANTEINDITLDGLIGPEIKFIGTVIYQTNDGYANAVKSRIRSTDTGDEYVDLRDFPFTRGGVSGTLTDHGALTGLGDDDHLQYMPVDQSRGFDSPLTVPNGGSGVATITDHALVVGSGTSAMTVLSAATNGQIPIGSTGADPVLALPGGTANQITVTPGAGTLAFSLPQDIGTSSPVVFGTISGTTITGKTGFITDGDNDADIGDSTNAFKDLYMQGDVYFDTDNSYTQDHYLWKPILSQTASSSSSLEFTLDSNYDVYWFSFNKVLPATDNQPLYYRTGVSSSYTSRYAVSGYQMNATSGLVASSYSDSSSALLIQDIGSSNETYAVWGDFYLYNCNDSGERLRGKSSLIGIYYNNYLYLQQQEMNHYAKSTEATDTIKFLFGSGNIASGTITLYGRKNIY